MAMHIYANIYVFLYVTYRPVSVPYGLDELAVASETNIEANARARRAGSLTQGLSWGEVIGELAVSPCCFVVIGRPSHPTTVCSAAKNRYPPLPS